ncbi:hypothetical protein SCMU_34050 [Sinomonas cyclohexanicum]|uniref:Formyltetrahydrofolate deformylase n=1 Tax=Sinomonas cyclohexanicum TaxID=322009 RepID=A0ABN6FLB9_SINCY|nr:hypothetical protein SCMU_34050 [Corynebacterium cyclohexanicum]
MTSTMTDPRPVPAAASAPAVPHAAVPTLSCPQRAGIVHAGHRLAPQRLATVGRDAEILARAVRWHAENRVLLSGHRTVVFP